MARKNRKKTKLNPKSKTGIIKKVILLVILLLVVFAVVYPNNSGFLNNNKRINLTDMAIFPGSTETLYTKDENRVTISYQTGEGVIYNDVLTFYQNKMPGLGWKLVSVTDYDLVFEKDTRKIRIWILYTDTANVKQTKVDYIIDYSASNQEPPPAF